LLILNPRKGESRLKQKGTAKVKKLEVLTASRIAFPLSRERSAGRQERRSPTRILRRKVGVLLLDGRGFHGRRGLRRGGFGRERATRHLINVVRGKESADD